MALLTSDQKKIAKIYLLGPEKAQEILDARTFDRDGLTTDEIAVQMGLSVDEVLDLLDSPFMKHDFIA